MDLTVIRCEGPSLFGNEVDRRLQLELTICHGRNSLILPSGLKSIGASVARDLSRGIPTVNYKSLNMDLSIVARNASTGSGCWEHQATTSVRTLMTIATWTARRNSRSLGCQCRGDLPSQSMPEDDADHRPRRSGVYLCCPAVWDVLTDSEKSEVALERTDLFIARLGPNQDHASGVCSVTSPR